MSYYTPDLTGQKEEYWDKNNQYRVHTYQQKIEFDEPVFLEGLAVHELGSVQRKLIKGVDWEIKEDDKDNTTLSKMMAYDNDFDKTLIKSITMKKLFTKDFDINISMHKLYPIASKAALLRGSQPLGVSPDLLNDMLKNVEYLLDVTDQVSNSSSSYDKDPLLLEEDIHFSLEKNKVKDEEHGINTVQGLGIIRPVQGDFYNKSFTIKIIDSPDILIEGVDYFFTGYNKNKTRKLTVPQEVYSYIAIKKELVGRVKISYHAYGGEITRDDVDTVNQKTNDIIKYLSNLAFLTKDTLSTAPIIKSMITKIQEMEDNMRILYEVNPAYGDVTHNNSAVHTIKALDDDNHWYTVASLYTVDDNPAPILSDRIFLRLAGKNSGLSMDIMVNVNLTNPTGERVKVTTLSANYPKGYIPLQNYDKVSEIFSARVRIIWNENEQNNSGALLQIGFSLKGIAQEILGLHDMSGKESSFKLLASSDAIVPPQDSDIQLPNTSHVYSTSNPDSRSEEHLIPKVEGHVVSLNMVSVNKPAGGYKLHDIVHQLDDDINLSDMTKCRIELQEESGELVPLEIPLSYSANALKGKMTFSYNDEVGYMACKVFKDNNVLKFQIITDIDDSSSHPELLIRHIFIYN